MATFNVQFAANPSGLEFSTESGVIHVYETNQVTATEETKAQQQQINQILEKVVGAVEQNGMAIQSCQRDFQLRSEAFITKLIEVLFENDAELTDRFLGLKIEAAIKAISLDEEIKVYVHPEKTTALSGLGSSFPNASLKIEPDPNLPLMDCLVESQGVGLISQLEHHLEQIRERMIRELTEGQGGE